MTRTQYVVAGWGEGELWTSEQAVVAHDFRFDDAAVGPEQTRARTPMGGSKPPTGTVTTAGSRVGNGFVPSSHTGADVDPKDLVARFRAFLRGEAVELGDVPLDLEHHTEFERALAAVLRRIPRGEVVAYGELAALAGSPRAARAAGTFCARNRFMLLLPCHRVVGAHSIGGYGSSGVEVKRRLLSLEGVRL